MAQKDEFVEALLQKQAAKGKGCLIGRFLRAEEVPTEVQEGIARALEVERITAPTIAEVLTEHGFECTDRPVWRHRAKKCSCWKGIS